MTQHLRDELAQLADRSPTLAVPEDTWSRGRRDRRRDRVAVGVAAVSLALVGGVGALVAGPPGPAPAGPAPEGGAVPSTIHPVPAHLQVQDDRDRFTGPVSPTLAVGRGSVAFMTGHGLPVVVGARDGAYHLLDLPGWSFGDTMAAAWIDESDSQPIALSPDGRLLAWSWAQPGGRTSTAEVPSGVRVADLETGAVRTIRLSGTGLADGAQAIHVRSLGWSPDSRWLVWAGVRLAQWNAGGMSGTGGNVAGRIGPGATTSEPLPTTRESSVSWSVTDDGAVVRSGQGSGVRVVERGDGFRFDAERPLDVTPVGAASPDGTRVALGHFAPGREVVVVDLSRRAVVPRGLSRQVFPGGDAYVRPLGWLDDRTMVVVAEADDDGVHGQPHVAILSSPDVPREQWTYRIVARVEPGGDMSGMVQFPSVAVDLMTRADPTRAFPAPDWPWSTGRRVAVGVLAAVGLALAAYLLLRRLRRPHP